MIVEQESELPAVSATLIVRVFVPSSRTAESERLVPAIEMPCATVLVWTSTPFRFQSTERLSPSMSETEAVSTVVAPHSIVVFVGQTTAGGVLIAEYLMVA